MEEAVLTSSHVNHHLIRIGFHIYPGGGESRIDGLIIWRTTAPRPVTSQGRVWEFGFYQFLIIPSAWTWMVEEAVTDQRLREPPYDGEESSNPLAHNQPWRESNPQPLAQGN